MSYTCIPDYHDPTMCLLEAPADPPAPPNFFTEDTYTVLLTMRDRYGNKCDRGGAVVGSRLIYLKQGVHDSTSLTSTNHAISVDDCQDGTYSVLVSLMLGSSARLKRPGCPIGGPPSSTSMEHREAQAPSVHPRAPPQQLGGPSWPQPLASCRPRDEASHLATQATRRRST